MRKALRERYPEGIVPKGVSKALIAEFGITRQRASQAIKELGSPLPERTVILAPACHRERLGSPVRTAIAVRFPAGVFQHGASMPIAREFGASQARVSVAIKGLGFRVGPAPR